MEPKSILHKNGSLEILIDAKSFVCEIDNNSNVKVMLSYIDVDFFDFLRPPYNTGIIEIDKIPHFDNNIDENKQSGGIEYRKEGKWAGSHAVTPILQNKDIVGKEIFHKDTLSNEEWEKIWNVFVHHSLADSAQIFHKKTSIFVTEDTEILENRTWFLQHIPGEPMIIVTVQEALEIMDLFAKNLGNYLIEPFILQIEDYGIGCILEC